MKKVLITLVAMLGIAVAAHATSYKVDDGAIDALIENAAEVNVANLMDATMPPASPASIVTKGNGKEVKPAVALILNAFVGVFGVHRHYMGTSNWMWLLYTLTGGGLGIVVTIDFVMLIIGVAEDDISQYIDNTKFLMWV